MKETLAYIPLSTNVHGNHSVGLISCILLLREMNESSHVGNEVETTLPNESVDKSARRRKGHHPLNTPAIATVTA